MEELAQRGDGLGVGRRRRTSDSYQPVNVERSLWVSADELFPGAVAPVVESDGRRENRRPLRSVGRSVYISVLVKCVL